MANHQVQQTVSDGNGFACIPLTEGYEWPADDPLPVAICQDTWFSVLLTAISILAMIFYVYRLCKSQTSAKATSLEKP